MNASELLRTDKPLAEWWIPICHDPRFDKVVALVRASLAETEIEREHMVGVNKCVETLKTITDGAELSSEFPSPGLIHQMPDKPHQKAEQVPAKK